MIHLINQIKTGFMKGIFLHLNENNSSVEDIINPNEKMDSNFSFSNTLSSYISTIPESARKKEVLHKQGKEIVGKMKKHEEAKKIVTKTTKEKTHETAEQKEQEAINIIKSFDVKRDSNDNNKISELQKALNIFLDGKKLVVDGKFGPHTNKIFEIQKSRINGVEVNEKEDKVVETYPAGNFTEYIGLYSRGPKVSKLQAFLGLKETGRMNAETKAAVMLVQSINGLDPDGVIGRKTRELLNSGKAKKPQSFPNFNERKSGIPTSRLDDAFDSFAKAKASFFRSFEKYATPKEINAQPGSKELQAKIAEYFKTAKGNEKELYAEMIKLITPIYEDKKMLRRLESFKNRNVPSIRVILLAEFINASMHGVGNETTPIKERIAREKNLPNRLNIFKRDFDPILAGTQYDIRGLEQKYYEINSRDPKLSKYYKNTITLVGRPEGKGGAVAGTKELEGKTVKMKLNAKIVAELLSPAFNFEYFQNIFEHAGLGSPTRNEMLVAIMTGKYKGRKINAQLFFGKAANCLNDLIGLKISIPRPPRHVRHKKHVRRRVHKKKNPCTAMDILNGKCGPQIPSNDNDGPTPVTKPEVKTKPGGDGKENNSKDGQVDNKGDNTNQHVGGGTDTPAPPAPPGM